MKGYDIKLRLKDVKPKTWRDLVIPSDITFHQLHRIIQISFGFLDCHRYLFDLKDRSILNFENTERESGDLNSLDTYIEEFFDERKRMRYCYDFTDSWEVIIEIKRKIDYNKEYPRLKRYKGEYNPPEDCGGPYMFTLILDSILNDNKEILAFTNEKIYNEFIEDTEEIDVEYTQYLLIGEFDYDDYEVYEEVYDDEDGEEEE